MMNETRDNQAGAPQNGADDDGFSIGVLVERLDGDEEIAREVAVAFVESSRELLQELDRAIGAGQADAVRLHAHSIKGAAANIGADHAAEIAAVIEDAGRDAELATAAQAVPGLKERLEAVCVLLENWS
jgi:HPt (histidine-containing phosphotransfer) domain-containing protein